MTTTFECIQQGNTLWAQCKKAVLEAVQKEPFQAWLETLDPQTILGNPGDNSDCPLHHYLEVINAFPGRAFSVWTTHIAVEPDEDFFDDNDWDFSLDSWAYFFQHVAIGYVHRRETAAGHVSNNAYNPNITAGETLRVLKSL